MLVELGEHYGVIAGVDHHRHVGMVLGGGADHGGAADVDVFDASRKIGALRDRCFKRIKADDEEIDRPDAMRTHGRGVLLIIPHSQQAAVHFGVKRLHPTIHHFGETGQLGNVEYGKPSVRQRFAGAAG